MSEDKKVQKEGDQIEDNDENREVISDEIRKLQDENIELKDKWQRALADYQNLERRTQTEISQRVSEKIDNLLLNFINILSLIHISEPTRPY